MIGTDRIFLGEGGLMTEFFFGEETKDIELPESSIFFGLIKDEKMMDWVERYHRKFMDLCLKENNEFGYIMLAFFTYKGRKQEVKKHLNIDEDEWITMNRDFIQRCDDIR